jgi:hypothetical protein
MTIVLIGYLLTLVSVNAILSVFRPAYFLIWIVYWNATNLLYIILDVTMLMIINFESYECVRYCLMNFCYV